MLRSEFLGFSSSSLDFVGHLHFHQSTSEFFTFVIWHEEKPLKNNTSNMPI